MGLSASLQQRDVDEISAQTNLRADEVRALFRRFVSLDKRGQGILCKRDLLLIPELAANPLVDSILEALFGLREEDDSVNFVEFAHAVAVLSGRASLDDKIALLFRVFAPPTSTFPPAIGAPQLRRVLAQMVGLELPDDVALDAVVRATLHGRESITEEQFRARLVVARTGKGVKEALSLKFLGDDAVR